MIRLATVVLFAICVVGCGRIHYLPGHTEENEAAPPDVTMRVGERTLALQNGLNPLDMPPPELRSENPNIVKADMPDKGSAYLVAVSVGSARVHYDVRDGEGFIVHVVPAN